MQKYTVNACVQLADVVVHTMCYALGDTNVRNQQLHLHHMVKIAFSYSCWADAGALNQGAVEHDKDGACSCRGT